MSQFVDKIFDETYNETLIAEDMPNLRWGRIDYLNVTYLTTKWGVWQCVLYHAYSSPRDIADLILATERRPLLFCRIVDRLSDL